MAKPIAKKQLKDLERDLTAHLQKEVHYSDFSIHGNLRGKDDDSPEVVRRLMDLITSALGAADRVRDTEEHATQRE